MTKCQITTARLGLGCNRLGSVLGAPPREAERLVHEALELGVGLFDTADIYGQGESERVLGRVLGRGATGVTIVTKAGQYFPQPYRALLPLKRFLAPVVRSFGAGQRRLSAARAGPLPQDFSPAYLRRAAERSLKRLNAETLDVFLLHSPPSSVLAAGEAMGALCDLKSAGKVQRVGVSCEEFATAIDTLGDPRIEVVQFPLGKGPETADLLQRAGDRTLIARGLFSSLDFAPELAASDRAQRLATRVRGLLAEPSLDWLLIGTTRLAHLREVAFAATHPLPAEAS